MSDKQEDKHLFRLKHLIPSTLLVQEPSVNSISSNTTNMTGASKLADVEEFNILFEWGNVAAKVWGPLDGKPMLAIHGWLDNLGTFDTLFPLLPNDFRIVAIDLPGHGLSAHYPLGISYQFIDCLPRIRQIASRLSWDKFSIIGHSLGGAMAALYAGIYPETVEKLILLDIVRPQATFPDTIHLRLRKASEVILKSEKELEAPLDKPIMYEKAIKICIAGSGGSLDQHSAEILLKRGLKESGTGYVFRRDRRLRAAPLSFTPSEDLLAIGRQTTCDILIIKANQGPWFEREERLQEQLEAYRMKARKVVYCTVEGGHHVHLTNPERIAPIISQFLVQL